MSNSLSNSEPEARSDNQNGLFSAQIDYGAFPKAILLTGIPGVGKKTMSREWAKGLLCRSEGPERPCGRCRSCRRIEKGISHENLMFLTVSKNKKSIGVDQVKESVVDSLSRSSLERGNRVVLIHGADMMTPQAQNALLKTLEDPPDDHTYFILTADRPYAILPTITSRCGVIHAPLWDEKKIRTVLLQKGYPRETAESAALVAGGSIGAAIDLCGNKHAVLAEQIVADTFFRVRSYSDIQAALAELREQKDMNQAELKALQQRLALLLSLRARNEEETAARLFDPEWVGAPIRSLEVIFNSALQAAQYRASNVNWTAEAENIMRIILEERKTWRL